MPAYKAPLHEIHHSNQRTAGMQEQEERYSALASQQV